MNLKFQIINISKIFLYYLPLKINCVINDNLFEYSFLLNVFPREQIKIDINIIYKIPTYSEAR